MDNLKSNFDIPYWRKIYSGFLLEITYTLTKEEKESIRRTFGIDSRLT